MSWYNPPAWPDWQQVERARTAAWLAAHPPFGHDQVCAAHQAYDAELRALGGPDPASVACARHHFLGLVGAECDRAFNKHGYLRSGDEAYGVLLEEVAEVRAEVHTDGRPADLLAELVQVAATCRRWAECVLLWPQQQQTFADYLAQWCVLPACRWRPGVAGNHEALTRLERATHALTDLVLGYPPPPWGPQWVTPWAAAAGADPGSACGHLLGVAAACLNWAAERLQAALVPAPPAETY